MIQRINLVEKQSFAVTYLTLVQILVVVLFVNVALVSWKSFTLSRLKPKLEEVQAKALALKEEKKMIEKKPVVKKQATVSAGEYQNLFDALNAYPQWAVVLEEVTKNLPNAVWLTGLTSEIRKKVPVVKDPKAPESAKSQEKPLPSTLEKPESVRLTMTGLAADVDGLSVFVKNLQSSKYFTKTVVEESQKQDFGFQYTLKSDLNSDYVGE